jgi:hypothetical protein
MSQSGELGRKIIALLIVLLALAALGKGEGALSWAPFLASVTGGASDAWSETLPQ